MRKQLSAFQIYFHPDVLRVMLLGFVSGLPFPLVIGTLSFWLREEGVSRTDIGLFALVGTPWVIKFLWAPLVDQFRIPGLTATLGIRRSWIFLSQVGLILAILALGASDPSENLVWVAYAALALTICSATQDIAIDAFRIEVLSEAQQGAGAAAVVFGWRVGALVAGAAPFYIASQTNWFIAYACMAALIAVGIGATLLSHEPSRHDSHPERKGGDWLKHAIIEPFAEFMTRIRWPFILIFIILYKMGDAIALTMLSPFAVDLGFSKEEYATIVKLYGTFATFAGAFVGGALLGRLGIMRGLIICGILQMCSTLMFVWQSYVGYDLTALTLTISAENFASGMGTVAFVAYLSALCNARFTATQYALFSALASMARTWFSAASGVMVDTFDYPVFFLTCAALALPGLVMIPYLMQSIRHQPPLPPQEAEHEATGL